MPRRATRQERSSAPSPATAENKIDTDAVTLVDHGARIVEEVEIKKIIWKFQNAGWGFCVLCGW